MSGILIFHDSNIVRINSQLRTKIAGLTHLNKSTVSSIVTDLINEELVYEQKVSDPNIGRNPVNLSLKLGRYLVGAISIDAALTRFAITDIDGSVLGASFIDSKPGTPEEFLDRCQRELNSLCRQLKVKKLEGLGISVAGIVDSKNMIVNFAPNLGWEDYNIGNTIKELWPDVRILTVGNDAKCSACRAMVWRA